jgi:hypothetical protein
MALKGGLNLVGGNAASVIAHADLALAAIPNLNPNLGCTRVDRVLDQLLNDRRRPLNDLACRNFRRNICL